LLLIPYALWAGESLEVCAPSSGTFPLSDELLRVFTADPEEVKAGPVSDNSIVTPSDVYECGQGAKASTQTYDPAKLPDDGTVWRVGSNRWTTAMEQKFSEWITTEVGNDFFQKYNIPTDCADAVVSLRTIFARIHHLPAAYETGSGILGQSSRMHAGVPTVKIWNESNWKESLVKDQRFRKFLETLRNQMATKNINQSTYPIELTSCTSSNQASDYLSPGKLLLDSGHVRMISKMDPTAPYDPMLEVASTVPMKVRSLNERVPTLFSVPVEGQGVLGWRWPINCGKGFRLKASDQMAGYSKEQYSLKLPDQESFSTYLSSLVPGERQPYDEKYLEMKLAEIETDIQSRIDVVNDAQMKLKENPNVFNDRSGQAYDDYSTPSRDARIKNTFSDVINRLFKAKLSDQFEVRMREKKIDLGDGKWVDAMDFLYANAAGKVSSDPKASQADRWGFAMIQGDADEARREIQNEEKRLFNLSAQVESQLVNLIPSDRLLHDQGQLKTSAEKELLESKTTTHINKIRLNEALGRGAK